MTTPRSHQFRPGGRLSAIERQLDAAAKQRKRAEELVEGIAVLTHKLAELPAIPLDVLDHYERLIVAAHTSNLLRLPGYALDEEEVA